MSTFGENENVPVMLIFLNKDHHLKQINCLSVRNLFLNLKNKFYSELGAVMELKNSLFSVSQNCKKIFSNERVRCF